MEPRNLVEKMKRRMMPRRCSTGNSGYTVDNSCNTSTTTNSGNISIITEGTRNMPLALSLTSIATEKIHEDRISLRQKCSQSAYEYQHHGPSQQKRQENNSIRKQNKSSYRNCRERRRRSMNDIYQITDEPSIAAILFHSRLMEDGVVTDGDREQHDGDGEQYKQIQEDATVAAGSGAATSNNSDSCPCPTPTSSVVLRSSPTGLDPLKTGKTSNATATPTSTKKKHKRRSSLAKAASSVKATFETSRNWFSSYRTNNVNDVTDSSTTCTPQKMDDSNSIGRDDTYLAFNLQSQLASEQKELQALARKMQREGHLDGAITHWKKSLELAELNRDFSSLCSLTEIRYMLFDLHFQQSQRLKQEPEHETEAEASPTNCKSWSLSCDDGSLPTGGRSHCTLSLNEAVVDDDGDDDASFRFQDKQKRQLLPSSDNDVATTAAVAHHKREACQYINRIKPVMVQPQWLRCDILLMDFFCEVGAWELALIVAKKLSERSLSEQQMGEEGEETEKGRYSEESSSVDTIIVGPHKIAVIHFHIASLKLKSRKQGEAVQHLQETIQRLEEVSVNQRNMTMYLEALQLLASEYQHQRQTSLALETYRKQQNHAPPEQYAYIASQIAEICILDGRLDAALEELESTYDQRRKISDAGDDSGNNNKSNNDNDNNHRSSTACAIRFQLLQLQGEVYCRRGRMKESMQMFHQACKEAQNPADKANVLYSMGRLCIRMGRTCDAIACFMDELQITKCELGAHHLSVSAIYHDLAKLFDEGLGLHNMAIQKYSKALDIELAVMDDIRSTIASCNNCDAGSHQICDAHTSIHAQVQGLIWETKKRMGRIHFKLGDFDGAMKTGLSSDQL